MKKGEKKKEAADSSGVTNDIMGRTVYLGEDQAKTNITTVEEVVEFDGRNSLKV